MIIGKTAGLWGDQKNGASYPVGLLGTVDDGNAILVENNSSSSQNYSTILAYNESTDGFGLVMAAHSAAGGYCYIYVNGDLTCGGTVTGVVAADAGREVNTPRHPRRRGRSQGFPSGSNGSSAGEENAGSLEAGDHPAPVTTRRDLSQ